MNDEGILTIDLGSAYTKLAIRNNKNDDADLVDGLPLAPRGSFCVPSVLACIDGVDRQHWLIGEAAARQSPTETVRVWHDWKTSLFLQKPMSAPGPLTASQVAARFLEGLRGEVITHDPRLADLPVRICVPELSRCGGSPVDVSALAREAGWTVDVLRPQVFEPESNLIGVLSRGKNVVAARAPRFREEPQFRAMFDPRLAGALQALLDGRRSEYRFLIVDVGAFTTDFGFASINADFWGQRENILHVTQESFPLGITQLDRTVLENLPPDVRALIGSAPVTAWDSLKEKLYAGQPIAIARPQGGVTTFGEGPERDVVSIAIATFAAQVVGARRRFCDRNGITQLYAEMFTGGGTLIPGVREHLIATAQQEEVDLVLDLLHPSDQYRLSSASAYQLCSRNSIEGTPRTEDWFAAEVPSGAAAFFSTNNLVD